MPEVNYHLPHRAVICLAQDDVFFFSSFFSLSLFQIIHLTFEVSQSLGDFFFQLSQVSL